MPHYRDPESWRPIIAVYSEQAYHAAEAPGSGLSGYEPIILPAHDARAGVDFSDLPDHLRSRPVVIWPAPGAGGLALAREDAAALAQGLASAVDIVMPPGCLGDDDFELGQELPEGVGPDDVREAVDAALDDALACALPARIGGGRAVAPWPRAPDAGAMFAQARALLARYLAEPRTTLDTIVLWCLHAWCVHEDLEGAIHLSPRLILQANDARADHARALRLAAWLCPSPRIVSRAAHLLPAIEAERPTLLLDDVAGAILYRREMRALIAAGAARDSAFLVAAPKDGAAPWVPCFAPTAVATAIRLPEDVRMRAIVVPMSPVPAGDARERLALGSPPAEVALLRAQMSAFAVGWRSEANDADAALPRGLGAAERENWRPLFAVAAAIGAQATQGAIDAARALAEAAPAPASNLALLGDIRGAFGVDARTHIPTTQVIERLVADAELPWRTARRGGKIDARELAERLRVFGVRPASIKIADGQVVRGYRGEDLADAFTRYLGEPSAGGSVVVAAE